jgi:hypothetical protein
VFVFVISPRVVCSASEEVELIRGVQRRLDWDIHYYESTHKNCDKENRTYLVDERRCVNNMELIHGNKKFNKL